MGRKNIRTMQLNQQVDSIATCGDAEVDSELALWSNRQLARHLCIW